MSPEDLLRLADREAAELGAMAGPAELLAGAADVEAGAEVRADLLAQGLAVSHRLMLRLCATAAAVLDWSRLAAADDATTDSAPGASGADAAPGASGADTAKADQAAARIAAAASRLMEQVRLGLVALRRLRPADDDEGVWLALHWLDGSCPPEELELRIAAAKAARSANAAAANAPAADSKARPLSERARARRGAAAESALRLAEEARGGKVGALAVDGGRGARFLERVYAHQLGAAHALMMRLAGAADRALDRAVARKEEPAVALRLSGVVARLGDRYRRGHLALVKIDGGRGQARAANPVWGGGAGGYDGPATAGHGVLRPDREGAPKAAA